MSKMKCPFCQQELVREGSDNYWCKRCNLERDNPALYGSQKLWQELIRTRKALDCAIGVIQTVAKMSDKLSREYGETLVEQLDNIQAYCWQEGYVLTHEEDLSKALTKGGDNE